MVTALLLLGFPLALIVAWAFELTPDGVRRTEAAGPGEIDDIVTEPAGRRWRDGLLALIGIAALASGTWWIGTQTGFPEAQSEDAPAAGDDTQRTVEDEFDDEGDNRPSIAVLPFQDMRPEGDQAATKRPPVRTRLPEGRHARAARADGPGASGRGSGDGARQ